MKTLRARRDRGRPGLRHARLEADPPAARDHARSASTRTRRPNAGDEVVEEHTEETLGHEEIYAVVAGRATFTVDGEEVDAPAGTLVYLDDPQQRRAARRRRGGDDGAAIGGVPGEHEPSAWEYFFPALPASERGRVRAGRARSCARASPSAAEHPVLLYHLACFEARAGHRGGGAGAPRRAPVAADERCREWAAEDEDFASIRDDPRFPALGVAREPQPGGALAERRDRARLRAIATSSAP